MRGIAEHRAYGQNPRHTVAVFVIAAIAAGALSVACRDDRTEGSGTAVTVQRDVPAFTEVRVRGAINAEIAIGATQSVSITGDDNVVPVIRTEVRDGRLAIVPDKSYDSETPLRVAITVARVTRIEASGASTVTAAGITGDALAIDASGASTVRAAGQVGSVEANASGASRLRLLELAAGRVDVDASGASTIEVQATERLTGEASGASTIRYAGSPTVDVDTSGASSVRAQ